MKEKKIWGIWILRRIFQVLFLYCGKYHRGFLNLIYPQPLAADLKITERCNSRCVTCDVWKSEYKKKYTKSEITKQELLDVFYQFKDLGIKTIGFSGGEPLLREDIGELVRNAKEITEAKVYVVTNGLLLEKRAKLLLESGIDHISVSIDGIGKTNDEIRGIPGHYRKALQGIQKLTKLIGNNKKIKNKCSIGTTLVRSNISEVPRLIELAKSLGINWTFNLLDTNLYFYKNVDDRSLIVDDDKTVDQVIDYLFKVRDQRPDLFCLDSASLKFARSYLKGYKNYAPCALGYFRFYIDSQLNVYSGCWALKPLGNLKEQRLKDVIASNQYRKRVRDMFDLKCPGCTCGYIYNFMIAELPSTVKYVFSKLKGLRKYL